LTPREREVLLLLTARSQNKQIAYQLKLRENMVKIRRRQGMRKMRARSLVELVRKADKLDVSSGGP